MTEHKSKAKPEIRTEDKRGEGNEEAKPKKKNPEERKGEQKKDPKGKSRRIVLEDDASEEVPKIKAQPAWMAAPPRRAPRSTHLEVKDDAPSPCGSASDSSSEMAATTTAGAAAMAAQAAGVRARRVLRRA